jgi:hypothetical protein
MASLKTSIFEKSEKNTKSYFLLFGGFSLKDYYYSSCFLETIYAL